MMGMKMPETCWAVSTRQAINLRNCCIWLVDSFECMMMYGLANRKSRPALWFRKPHIKMVPQAFWPGLRQPAREAVYSSSIFEKEFSLETPLFGSHWMTKYTEWRKSHLNLDV
jgi:hypothetical protein